MKHSENDMKNGLPAAHGKPAAIPHLQSRPMKVRDHCIMLSISNDPHMCHMVSRVWEQRTYLPPRPEKTAFLRPETGGRWTPLPAPVPPVPLAPHATAGALGRATAALPTVPGATAA